MRNEFLKSLGIQAQGTDSMDSVVAKLVGKYVTEYLGKYSKAIPSLLAFSLYFILQIFSFLYKALIRLFAWFILKVLKWTKVVEFREEEAKVERVAIKV